MKMPDKHEAASAKEREHAPLHVRVISGSIGSIVTSLVVTPLDVVKVAIQAASSPPSEDATVTVTTKKLPPNVRPCPKGCGTFVLYNGQLDCILPRSAVPFYDKQTGNLTERARAAVTGGAGEAGTWSVMRRIYAAEGLGGIYAGLRPTLVMAVPNTVLYFSAYEDLVWRLRHLSSAGTDDTVATAHWIPLVAGATARVLASSVTAPFEFLRTRQASLAGMNQPSEGMWNELRNIVRTEGASTLYNGFRSTLWRDVPFSAIYWVTLEKMRDLWLQRQWDHRHQNLPPTPATHAMQEFVNGAISGTIAAACTTPFDVVKTRQQATVKAAETISALQSEEVMVACCHGGAVSVDAPHYSSLTSQLRLRSASMFAELSHIARTEGVRGLWKGNQARMLKVAPSCAIMISSYEFGKRILTE